MAITLEALRAQIKRLEERPQSYADRARPPARRWTSGLDKLDVALPRQQIGFNACHDFTPLNVTDLPHMAGFVAALLQRMPRNGPVVWCQTAFNALEYGRIYGPGLTGQALSPERLLFVHVPKDRDMALVLEECVRVPHVAAVVGEGPAPDFTASRRLTLAAQKSHVPCLILNTGDTGASAAATRWRVAPITGPAYRHDPQGPGLSAWRLLLVRARGANAALNPTLKKPLDIYWDNNHLKFKQIPLLDREVSTLQNVVSYKQDFA